MWTNAQFSADLFPFTKEALHGKLHGNFYKCDQGYVSQ